MPIPRVPSFADIEARLQTLGPRLQAHREARGWTAHEMAQRVIHLAGSEAHTWSAKLEEQKATLEKDINLYQEALSEIEGLKDIDRHTIRNWEQNKPVPGSFVTKLLADIFFGNLPEKQAEKEAFLQLGEETRKKEATNRLGRLGDNTLGNMLFNLREDSDYSGTELAELVKLASEMASPEQLKMKLSELQTQKTELEGVMTPAYILVDGYGRERTYSLEDVDGHVIRVIEAGAFPSKPLYELLKNTLKRHGAMSPVEEEKLIKTYEQSAMELAAGGVNMKKYLASQSMQPSLPTQKTALEPEAASEPKPVSEAARVDSKPAEPAIIPAAETIAPPASAEQPPTLSGDPDRSIENISYEITHDVRNKPDNGETNTSPQHTTFHFHGGNNGLKKKSTTVSHYAEVYAAIFHEFGLKPPSFAVNSGNGSLETNDKNGARAALVSKVGNARLSTLMRPFSLQTLPDGVINSLCDRAPCGKEPMHALCMEYNSLTKQIYDELFTNNKALQTARQSLMQKLDDSGYTLKKLAKVNTLHIEKAARLEQFLNGHVPDMEHMPNVQTYFNQLATTTYTRSDPGEGLKSGEHGHGWAKPYLDFFTAHEAARNAYLAKGGEFRDTIAQLATETEHYEQERIRAERYLGLCWMKENAGSKMMGGEIEELQRLERHYAEDPDFAAVVSLVQAEKKGQTNTRSANAASR